MTKRKMKKQDRHHAEKLKQACAIFHALSIDTTGWSEARLLASAAEDWIEGALEERRGGYQYGLDWAKDMTPEEVKVARGRAWDKNMTPEEMEEAHWEDDGQLMELMFGPYWHKLACLYIQGAGAAVRDTVKEWDESCRVLGDLVVLADDPTKARKGVDELIDAQIALRKKIGTRFMKFSRGY
jgi:hypothetical protein